MKHFKIFFALVFFALLFTNCDPNDSSSSSQNDDTFAENFGATASRDFIGQVVDVDNVPLQNVTIKIGTSTVQTDVNGVFIINGAAVHERFAYITAKKTGYIDGSRAMVPTNGKNNVKIMLLPNAPLETIQSGETSEVSIYSGTKVVFDGSFQDENGTAYTGAVQVAMFHLTPSDENIDKLMPGMLYAQTQSNEEAVLETFGMLNVELRGSAGQKLNLATGHTAEITIRIDDSQQATAPSTIPLWHFDEAKGYWKEDSVATKVDNKYVGEVSHFSWWNCDMPNSSILLTFNFVDSNGNPLSNLYMNLINSAGYHAGGVTDSNGQLAGILPANQTFTLHVQSSSFTCVTNNVFYSTTVGPFASDTVLPNIVINTSTTVLSSNVIGTLVKCDNTNVTNGYVMLIRPGYYSTSVSPVTNGAFSFNEIYCTGDTAFTLKGVDFDNFQESDSITYNFTTPITNVGNLQACTAIDSFISYQIDNNPVVFLVLNAWGGGQSAPSNGGLSVSGNNQDNSGLYIWGTTNIPGLYTTAQFQMEGDVGIINSTTTNTMQFNLSQFGAMGEHIDMTFGGTYVGANNVTHTLTGVVHVIRTF